MRYTLLSVLLAAICMLTVAVDASMAGKDLSPVESTRSRPLTTDSITVSLRASADTHVNNLSPTMNFGVYPHLLASYSPPSPEHIQYSFIRFELEGELPPGAIIESAIAGAYLRAISATSTYIPVPISVYPIEEVWYESTLTWNNQPSIGPEAGLTMINYPDDAWKKWHVTDLVRSWHDGTRTNYGFALKGPVTGFNGPDFHLTFHGREIEKGPYLDITYRVPQRNVYLPLVARSPGLGPLIFSDDFDDGDLDGWTPSGGTWENPSVVMQGGSLVGSVHNMRGETASDFVYEGKVFLLGGDAAGLAFRSSADGTSSYDVHINATDDVLRISRRSPYFVLREVSTPIEQARYYTLRAEVQGEWIYAYLDGIKVLEAWDPTYSDGQLGVVTWQTEAIFDDLGAWNLP